MSDDMKEIPVENAFNKFKPEHCVFVLSIDKSGKPNGMIAGWSMRCSWNPPLYAVSLSKKGYTHKLIRQSKEFVIAVPNKGLEKEVRFFGSVHGNRVNKFKKTGIATIKAGFVKTPLLRDATINFECRLEKEIDAGDHIIFIGRILASYVNESKKILFNAGRKDGKRVFREYENYFHRRL